MKTATETPGTKPEHQRFLDYADIYSNECTAASDQRKQEAMDMMSAQQAQKDANTASTPQGKATKTMGARKAKFGKTGMSDSGMQNVMSGVTKQMMNQAYGN